MDRYDGDMFDEPAMDRPEGIPDSYDEWTRPDGYDAGDEADGFEAMDEDDNENRGAGEATGPNQALQSYACVGNAAAVTSGRAAGACGVVTGEHGGTHNVLVDLPLRVMRRMAIGDRVQVNSCGVGLRLRPKANIARILAIRPLSPARSHRPLPERDAAGCARYALARNLHHVA